MDIERVSTKRMTERKYEPLTLQHDSTPRDAVVDLGAPDPFRDPRRRNYHQKGYESPHANDFGSTEATGSNRFGRKKQFVTSGVTAVSRSRGALVYGSEPGGRPVAHAAAVTLREKTSADIRKREQAMREIEEDRDLRRRWEMDERRRRDEEKRSDLEMLQQHNPWGKPGGGAPLFGPRGDVFAKKERIFLEEDADRSSDEFLSYFGRPGAGAPIRSESGKVKTSLKSDPDTRFQSQFKRDVELGLRYRNGSNQRDYLQSLDSQVEIQSKLQAEERKLDQEKVSEMLGYQPYGKPGAGAPIRDDKGNVVTSLKTGSFTSLVPSDQKEKYRKNLDFQLFEKRGKGGVPLSRAVEEYNPWGKGSGVPQRDGAGNVRRHLHSDKHFIRDSLTKEAEAEEESRPKRVAKIQHTLDQNVWDFPGASDDGAFPFGGGSSFRRGQEAMRRQMRREDDDDLARKSLEKKVYLEELRQDMEMRKKQREAVKKMDLAPDESLEIVDWLGSGRTGQPKRDPTTGRLLPHQHRSTSDVISQRLDIRRPDPRESVEYHRELDAHLEVKYQRERDQKSNGNRIVSGKFISSHDATPERISETKTRYGEELLQSKRDREREQAAERRREQSAERKHAEAYSGMWGRQGAGAPRRDDKGRVVANRNYKVLQEESYRTDTVRL